MKCEEMRLTERKKRTHEEFVASIHEKMGDKYTILSNFIDYRTKILVKCNICQYEWEVRPDVLLRGACPGCSKIKRSKSEDTFRKEIFEIHGKKYDLIGKYLNYQTRVLMKCKECGKEWFVLPSNLISKKSGCPECSKKITSETHKIVHDEFIKELEMKISNKYTLLTQYVDSRTKVLVRCNVDGYEWLTLPGSLYKGICPKCGNKVRRTNEMFIDEVVQKYGDEYTVMSEFASARQKVKMRHNICGHEWGITPDKFLKQNRKCPRCFGNTLKGQEEFEGEVLQKYKDRYTVLGKYINSQTHLLVRCNRCENEWLITPDNLLRGYGCPACNVSKGEDKIKQSLSERNIQFKFQYTFKDLYGDYGKPLRFDFAIFENNELKCLIEYDGKLHYELGGIQTQEKFDLQKSYDEKKDRYCEENEIPLFRIPYWDEDNIPNIIGEILDNK
jgi:hypothetical protein